MKLKEITFIFENCDRITIDGKYVGGFLADDIKTSVQRVACNAIIRMDTVHTFAIEIHKDANKERYAFGQTQIEHFKGMTFNRIHDFHDITSIEFELYDDYVEEGQEPLAENYTYYMHWTGDSEDVNDSQKAYISDCGNLYVVVAENKDIQDFFDMQAINNEDTMDFLFDMQDVGDKYSDPDRYKNEDVEE